MESSLKRLASSEFCIRVDVYSAKILRSVRSIWSKSTPLCLFISSTTPMVAPFILMGAHTIDLVLNFVLRSMPE